MLTKSTNSEPGFYMEKYGFGKHPHIVTCFTKSNFSPNQVFQCRVTQIYDPSKFWIVVKFQELEVFQKYLFRFYYMNYTRYQVPEEKIEPFMYCVISTDGGYYRGVVVSIPIVVNNERGYTVYLFDFGMLKSVTCDDIFYLGKPYAEAPQFVVRASLAGICPRKSQQWSCDDISNFFNLTNDKIFIGVITSVFESTQTLEIRIKEKNGSMPVHEKLVKQGCARYFDETPQIDHNEPSGCLEPILKYPYLYPSHDAIESGKIPTSRDDEEFQMTITPSANILSRYYT